MECVGQAVAFAIKSSNTTNWLSIGLNIGFSEYLIASNIVVYNIASSVIFSLPFAWLVIRKIGVDEFEEFNFDDTDEKRDGNVEVKAKDHEDASVTCH